MTQHLLEGRALDIAREVDSLYESINNKKRLMEEQSRREWETFSKRQNEQIARKMDELAEILGLSREDGPVHLDGTYFDELGVMFLTQEQPEQTAKSEEEMVNGIIESILTKALKQK